MKKYYTPGVYLISILVGVVVYIIASFFATPLLALLCGAVSVLIISLVIPISFAISDIKYKRFKAGIPAPFIIDERISCVISGSLQNGFMVLTRDTLFIITFAGKKPIRYEIKRDEVKKISITENIYLNIFLDYNKYIRIASGNCFEIRDKLSEQGFGR